MPTVDRNLLRAAREAAGLTREQAATALTKSFKAIEAYERGANVPPGNVLIAMAGLYGVRVEALCSDGNPVGTR
jgi:transcriptional regulator with XRE-family HTH domain